MGEDRRGQRAVGEREGATGLMLVQKSQVQDAHEQEGGTAEGVDEELERRLGALAPPQPAMMK
jgi:hypothetical protein